MDLTSEVQPITEPVKPDATLATTTQAITTPG